MEITKQHLSLHRNAVRRKPSYKTESERRCVNLVLKGLMMSDMGISDGAPLLENSARPITSLTNTPDLLFTSTPDPAIALHLGHFITKAL